MLRMAAHWGRERNAAEPAADRCGWLTGHEMRAHFTICPNRPGVSEHGDRRWRSLKVRRGRLRVPWMKYGWGCGTELTGINMRAHFTVCAKRPAASGGVERRRGTLKVKCGLPLRPRRGPRTPNRPHPYPSAPVGD
jgi:hypothetical protein